MDFEFHFTKEQEEFRKEVRTFIEENAAKEPIVPCDEEFITPELYLMGRELQKKLGAKRWFAPAYPKEYGGGGLDIEHCVILAQEFARIRDERRWPLFTEVSPIQTGGVMAQGTDEQKRRFLPKLLSGEWTGWQCFTEPDAGSDEAAMKSTAVREGDYYIISGDKIFVGETPVGLRPDYLYWPAVTDPKAPRHENISAFFIPSDLPGIKYEAMELTCSATGQKWEVWCENVRVPAYCLIGQENKGWLVTQATLALEHGGGGSVVPWRTTALKLIEYCKNTMRHGKPISSDPLIQDTLIKIYIEYHTERLWGLRNFQMAEGKIPRIPYTGTQTSLHMKRMWPFLGKAMLDILGPHAILDDPDLALISGEIEYQVRLADVTHPGGTPEVQQIIMARGLGLGRGSRAGAAPRGH
jgi:alkylation response protein AidB-like acyl-CoA dehydrogenase